MISRASSQEWGRGLGRRDQARMQCQSRGWGEWAEKQLSVQEGSGRGRWCWDREVFIPPTQSCWLGLFVGAEGSNFPHTSLTSMQEAKAGSQSWGQVLAGVF